MGRALSKHPTYLTWEGILKDQKVVFTGPTTVPLIPVEEG